jgi:hypothetical protein
MILTLLGAMAVASSNFQYIYQLKPFNYGYFPYSTSK